MSELLVTHASARPRPAGTVVWSAAAFAPPRSQRALSVLGALCLNAFLAAQFFSLAGPFFARHFGEGVARAAAAAGIDSVALLAPALLAYGLQAPLPFGALAPLARLWASAVAALSALLFLYGWLAKAYPIAAAVHDLCPYVVILSAVAIGSCRRAFRDVSPAMVVLFLAGLVLSVLGMADDPSTVARRLQGALAFWPLLLLTARLRRPFTAGLVFAGVSFVLAEHVLFGERGGALRVLVCVLVFLGLPRFAPREPGPRGRRRLAALAAGGAATLAVVLAAPARESGPFPFVEARTVLRTLGAHDVVLGRGLGGDAVPDAAARGEWPDDGAVVGRALHAGVLVPFLEGGLALALVYYSGLAYALWRGRRALRERLGAAAFFVVLIHAAFLLREDWFTMSVSFDLFVVGLCMGHLLSLERGRRPDRGARLIVVGDWRRGVAA